MVVYKEEQIPEHTAHWETKDQTQRVPTSYFTKIDEDWLIRTPSFAIPVYFSKRTQFFLKRITHHQSGTIIQ